jgi:D-glycero-D-manno-heptose 1,7-bisphosphate phosphatase
MSGNAKRAVFLDRDGVINRAVVREGKPYPPARLEELELLPGVREALASLQAAGYLLIVVTNQPDVARGKQAREEVERMHAWLGQALPVDEFRVCYHDDSAGCSCRKPKPGLLVEAARAHGVDLAASWMVGDRWRDIDAGRAAGCRTVWIDCQYRERGPEQPPDIRASSLPEAAAAILGASRIGQGQAEPG